MENRAELVFELINEKLVVCEHPFKERYLELLKEFLKDYYDHGDIDALKSIIEVSDTFINEVTKDKIKNIMDIYFSEEDEVSS